MPLKNVLENTCASKSKKDRKHIFTPASGPYIKKVHIVKELSMVSVDVWGLAHKFYSTVSK